jgi:single-stranded-DNA-specific exonuclease
MELSQTKNTFNELLERLFKKRNLSQNQLKELLSWDLKSIPDLTKLIDLEKAADRIIIAIERKEKIGIFGDYDVDGTTSCALLYFFFKHLNVDVELIQPSRFIEGYGIHPPSIDLAIQKEIKVLITVDCGITNCEAADYSKQRGIDLIITDHHQDAREKLPDAFAVVNPNRRDENCDEQLKCLAGVGVAFALCVQIKKNYKEVPSLYPLLQFVAIGTICDIALLNPLNLKLVRHGLVQMGKSAFPGILSFFTPQERKEPITEEKLGFYIGPLINSKGRLDHPEFSLNLLICDDLEKAHHLRAHLENCNNERKRITTEVFNSVKTHVLKDLDGEPLISVAYQSDWHEGVIGIVASKLVDFFKVPAIVFTNTEDPSIIKASARSAGELDLFEVLNTFSGYFEKFGGHKAAAGLSMKKDKYGEFKQKIKSLLREIPEIQRTRQDYYDIEIFPEEITPSLIKDMEKIGPFGRGNENPIFKMSGVRLDSFDILKDLHVRWNLSANSKYRFRGMSFNYIGKWMQKSPEEIFKLQKKEGLSIIFTLSLNRFNGNEYLQLMVQKIAIGNLI